MRICQLTAAESMFNFLGPLCRALGDRGHEVVAASNLDLGGGVAAGYLGEGVALHRVRGAREIDARAVTIDVAAMARYFRRERFDVLHVHGPLVSLQARLAARLAGVPAVISQAHGFYFHAGTRPVARWALRLVEQQFTRHLTDALVTVNREDHALAVRHRFRPDPAQIVHVPSVGIDVQRFRPDRTAGGRSARDCLRNSLGATAQDLVVVFVGRLVGEKGLDDLAEAFARTAPARGLALWLVGDVLDSERDRDAPARVARRLADAGLAGRVRFLGRRDDIPQILLASDLFVLPSHREGMPVSLLEAMACELPVVATDIRGSREVVQHERTGLLVPAHDAAALSEALTRLHDDPALRRRIAVAGRERVLEGYTVEAGLAPLLDLYDRLHLQARPVGAIEPVWAMGATARSISRS